MKKKIICMLLVGMLSTSVSMNFVFAESVTSKEEVSSVELTEDNNKPVIYEKDGLRIAVQKTEYDSNWGNPFCKVYFMVENTTDNNVRLSMEDSSIDGFVVSTYVGNSSVNAGKKGIVDFSIWENDFKPYGIDDFKIWESTLKIIKDNEDIATYMFCAEKNIFVNEDSGTLVVEGESNSKSSDDNSDSSEEVSKLQEQIESLTSENAELKDKVSSLESENEKLIDENKNLEDENEKIKKENKELKQTTPAPEETSTPEPTEVPQTPITEYKDATTIRITQQALNEVGYNCGTPDGVAGGKTSQAITEYQTAKGITVNGLITDELLQSLGIVERVQEAVKAEGAKAEYSSDYSYDQLARNPDTYMSQKIKITGKVLQAETSEDVCYARVAMNSDYDTVIFVTYENNLLGYRLLENDQITVYGTSLGVYSYKAVSGATITIPWLNADIIEM